MRQILVSFTDPNKLLPNVKSQPRFPNWVFSVSEIYRFITFQGIEILCFIKHCLLKFMSGIKWW